LKKLFYIILLVTFFLTSYSYARIEVYFNDPANIRDYADADADHPYSKLIDFLLTADTSIDLILYDLNIEEIGETLKTLAEDSGVQIRAVFPEKIEDFIGNYVSPANSSIYQKIQGVSYFEMHHKVAIIDGQRVTTGSTNWTFNGFFRNNNHILFIYNEEITANYQAVFDQLYAGDFEEDVVDIPNPIVTLSDGTIVNNYFSPNGRVIRNILDTIKSAKENIYFFCFTFTHSDITDALLNSFVNNVGVKGITEVRQVQSNWLSYKPLVDSGVPIVKAMSDGRMHHKAAVIDPGTDNATVIAGSANWTPGADDENFENTIIIKGNKFIAKEFLDEFNKLWTQNSALQPSTKEEIISFYNKPNPASEYTIFVYELPLNTVQTEINIFTLAAEKVRTIINPTNFSGGINEYVYDLKNDYGRNLASGLYFAEVKVIFNTGKSAKKINKMLIRRK
jgi:phosphatidylserine/phosphatidylglycerophosphate/cardiolipin synthase-like enzyme